MLENFFFARLFMQFMSKALEHNFLILCWTARIFVPHQSFAITHDAIKRALHHKARIVELFGIHLHVFYGIYHIDKTRHADDRYRFALAQDLPQVVLLLAHLVNVDCSLHCKTLKVNNKFSMFESKKDKDLPPGKVLRFSQELFWTEWLQHDRPFRRMESQKWHLVASNLDCLARMYW